MNALIVNLGHTYFLLDNGEIIYSSSGLDPDKVINDGKSLMIEANVMTLKDLYVKKWCKIVASSYHLEEIEEIAKQYYVTNVGRVRYFCRNLGFTQDKYKYLTATQKLIS